MKPGSAEQSDPKWRLSLTELEDRIERKIKEMGLHQTEEGEIWKDALSWTLTLIKPFN